MKKVWIKIVVFMLMLLPVFALAQESSPKATKAQKKADAKTEQRLMNEKKSEIEGRKMHMAIQTKEVRKRMKKSAKEADRWNTGKRKFFLVRWFEKKK